MASSPPAKPVSLPVEPDHAMARTEDGDRVLAVGGPDGPHRRRAADLPCQLAVGAGLAERDAEERVPDLLLERGAPVVQPEGELLALPGEVFAELALGLDEDRVVRVLHAGVQSHALRIVALPQDGGETRVASHEPQ